MPFQLLLRQKNHVVVDLDQILFLLRGRWQQGIVAAAPDIEADAGGCRYSDDDKSQQNVQVDARTLPSSSRLARVRVIRIQPICVRFPDVRACRRAARSGDGDRRVVSACSAGLVFLFDKRCADNDGNRRSICRHGKFIPGNAGGSCLPHCANDVFVERCMLRVLYIVRAVRDVITVRTVTGATALRSVRSRRSRVRSFLRLRKKVLQ